MYDKHGDKYYAGRVVITSLKFERNDDQLLIFFFIKHAHIQYSLMHFNLS